MLYIQTVYYVGTTGSCSEILLKALEQGICHNKFKLLSTVEAMRRSGL